MSTILAIVVGGVVFVGSQVAVSWVLLSDTDRPRDALLGAFLLTSLFYVTFVLGVMIASTAGAIHIVLGWVTGAALISFGFVLFLLNVTKIPVIGRKIDYYLSEIERTRGVHPNYRMYGRKSSKDQIGE